MYILNQAVCSYFFIAVHFIVNNMNWMFPLPYLLMRSKHVFRGSSFILIQKNGTNTLELSFVNSVLKRICQLTSLYNQYCMGQMLIPFRVHLCNNQKIPKYNGYFIGNLKYDLINNHFCQRQMFNIPRLEPLAYWWIRLSIFAQTRARSNIILLLS